MKRLCLAAALAATLVLAATPSARAEYVFFGLLDGSQETPPNPSTGLGFLIALMADDFSRIDWAVSYSGLTGSAVSGRHFHRAPAGSAGGIVKGYDSVPYSVPDGTRVASWAATDATQPLTNALAIAWFEGEIYFNIHTSPSFGGGEIRGQMYFFFSY